MIFVNVLPQSQGMTHIVIHVVACNIETIQNERIASINVYHGPEAMKRVASNGSFSLFVHHKSKTGCEG